MKPVLVTCVYYCKSNQILGGKDHEEGLYVGSLKNLSKLNMPMHLYCWPHMVDYIDEMIKPFFKEYKIIGCDLLQWPKSQEILETKNNFCWIERKNKNGITSKICLSPRNELLCHWKLKWCSMARDNEWGCDKVFWIDAGVTEWCKIPLSLGGAEYVYPKDLENQYPDSHFWPKNKNNIFNEKITDGIKRIFNDKKWFFITMDQCNDRLSEYNLDIHGNKTSKILYKQLSWKVGHTYSDKEKKSFNIHNCVGITLPDLKNYTDFPNWTVGTFFGGCFDELDNVILPEYMNLLDAFTNDHEIYPFTEEPYYSIISALHDYNLFWFDYWNHGHKEEPCYHRDCKKPFYTTLLDVINYKSD